MQIIGYGYGAGATDQTNNRLSHVAKITDGTDANDPSPAAYTY